MGKFIYLIRHGRPYFKDDISLCIGGGSDPPLSCAGRGEAERLAGCFPNLETIYSSPQKRCLETARLIGTKETKIIQVPALTELDMGEWEGLSFREIRKRYPNTYAARGLDWSIPPDGGESLSHAAKRMQDVLLSIAEKEKGDVTAVTSDGVIRALLWKLLPLDPETDPMIRQPYAGITVLKYEKGTLRVTASGKLSEDAPSDGEIKELWDLCRTPDPVRFHSEAVSGASIALWEELKKKGVNVSRDIIRAGALLHDLCKTEGRAHAHIAGEMLRERGYLMTARIVEAHDTGEDRFRSDTETALIPECSQSAGDTSVCIESEVLYLADKMMRGTEPVSLEERFEMSGRKCVTEEARKMHRFRFSQALSVRTEVERLTGKKAEEIIKI